MNTGAFIHDLLDWIDNNLDSRLDIETVSRRAGYSKWHLQRLFKEHTGSPLAEYIRAQKLQKSVERLAHSDELILNVAIALGFDSQQSFNRSFKRQYGQAPGMATQYRPWIPADEPVARPFGYQLQRKPSVNRGFYQSYLLITSQERLWAYSHSIVAGGLPLMSYDTRYAIDFIDYSVRHAAYESHTAGAPSARS